MQKQVAKQKPFSLSESSHTCSHTSLEILDYLQRNNQKNIQAKDQNRRQYSKQFKIDAVELTLRI
ncbi:MAG: hypothetical protein WCK32_03480 [Chlorobiaceae bacterium]